LSGVLFVALVSLAIADPLPSPDRASKDLCTRATVASKDQDYERAAELFQQAITALDASASSRSAAAYASLIDRAGQYVLVRTFESRRTDPVVSNEVFSTMDSCANADVAGLYLELIGAYTNAYLGGFGPPKKPKRSDSVLRAEMERSYSELFARVVKARGSSDRAVAALYDLSLAYCRPKTHSAACPGEEAALKEALQLRTSSLGARHPLVCRSMLNLAAWQEMHGKLADADATYRRVLEAAQSQGAPPSVANGCGSCPDPRSLRSLPAPQPGSMLELEAAYSLAAMSWRRGKLDDAWAIARRLLAKSGSAEERVDAGRWLAGLGEAAEEAHAFDLAAELYEQHANLWEGVGGAFGTSAPDKRMRSASLYAKLGKLDKAAELYARAIDAQEKVIPQFVADQQPEMRRDLAKQIEAYAAVLQALGQKERAAAARDRARKLRD
jgi:tetratricopeptide (TPR) repeat protein